MGILPGWWLEEDDARIDEPYVTPERWDREFKDAGFSRVDALIYDSEKPYHVNANIVAKPRTKIAKLPKRVTLLHEHDQLLSSFLVKMMNLLQKVGYEVDLRTLGLGVPGDQDIISVLDLDSPFFVELDQY